MKLGDRPSVVRRLPPKESFREVVARWLLELAGLALLAAIAWIVLLALR